MAAGLQTLQSLCRLLPTLGDRPAVGVRGEFGVRWWSYARLHAEALCVAGVLRDRGIPRGRHIVLWAPNCPEWVSFLLGAALRGVIVVPADDSALPGYVEGLADQVSAALVVHGLAQDASAFQRPTLTLFDRGARPPGDGSRLTVPVDPDDPALIMFTSATTQGPKGVIVTHRNVVAPVSQFQRWRWLARVRPFRLLVLAPLGHS